MKKAGPAVLLLLLTAPLFSQDYLAKNEYFYSLSNGVDIMVVQDSSAKEVSFGIAFQTGLFGKDKNYEGYAFLYQRILCERIKETMPQFALDSAFRISSVPFYEYAGVQLSFPENYLSKVLETVKRCVSIDSFSTEEIADAITFSNSELQRLAGDTLFSVRQKIEAALWESDFQRRRVITSWNDSLAQLVPPKLQKLKDGYFCPRNALLAVKSRLAPKSVYDQAKNVFTDWVRCETNPFTRFPAPNYRTSLFSRQLIDESPGTRKPFFQIAFPGPNTFEDMKGNLCALVLGSLMENPETKTHRYLADSCGILSASLDNDLGKYISQITFEFTPEAGRLAEAYVCFREYLFHARDSLLDEQELAAGKETLIQKVDSIIAGGDEHVSRMIHFWASSTINDYSTFADSVNALTVKDMNKTFESYFLKRKYVAALSISPAMHDSSKIDTTFTPTGIVLNDYRLNFLKNSAQLAGAADDSVLNSVIQFAKINPELIIKVNGVCHSSELLQITDKDMFRWVRSIEGFLLNPPSLINTRKFRLDVYRSLTIIRKMMDAGIEKKRLFGTGTLIRKIDEPEKYQYVHFKEVLAN